MLQCEFCEDWFHPNCLDPKLDIEKADDEIGDFTLMCSSCVKDNLWIHEYVKSNNLIEIGDKRKSD